MDGLSERWLGHTADPATRTSAGSGKSPRHRRQARRPRQPATAYAAEGRRRHACASGCILKPRLAAERASARPHLRDGWNARWCRCSPAWKSAASTVDRQILSRLSGELRPEGTPPPRPRFTSSPASATTSGSPKQLGDILFGQHGPARRHEDQRPAPWSTSAQVLGRPRRRRCTHCRREIVDWRQLTKLKSTYTDCAARPTSTRRPSASTPPTRWRRRQQVASRRQNRTCRTSRSAPDRRPQDPRRPSSRPPATS